MNSENPFENVPIIYSYTRQQAIEDGILVDLTEWARETGFRIPVACTAAVWSRYIVPPEGTKELGQSERGRAHDLLWMLFNAIRSAKEAADLVFFRVLFLASAGKHETVRLKAICGPGDDGKPAITVMLPNED